MRLREENNWGWGHWSVGTQRKGPTGLVSTLLGEVLNM